MRTFLLACPLLLLALAGCSSSPTTPKVTTPAVASNDTPANTVQRLLGTYDKEMTNDYAGLFTGDFTYQFSNSTDPTLVQQYSAGWFKADEKASSSHLFQGYAPPGGVMLPAASGIQMKFATTTPIDDNSAGVDPATHKMLATRVDGSITVPGSPEPTTYLIDNNYDVFYFVRGDSAVGLDSSQPADDKHWYIYKWLDQTQAAPAPLAPVDAARTMANSWGRLKALYR